MEFFSRDAGQARRNALQNALAGLTDYIPPELRPWLGVANELNPVTSMERAGTNALRVADPNVQGWDKVAAVGDTVSNMANALAPVVLGSSGAVPAANAVEEALMGFSAASPMAYAARDFVTDEFGGVGFRAYHGSPHDFDRFSLDKIGTGEGAQAYGHGLYFAESEGVARAYREGLSGVEPKGVDFSAYGIPEAKAKRLALNWMDYQRNNPDELAAFADDSASGRIVRDILDGKITEGVGGRMYEVQINADPNDFLDWDKPLSDQPAALNAVPRAIEMAGGMDAVLSRFKDATPREMWRNWQSSAAAGDVGARRGKEVVELLDVASGSGPEAASALRQAGIPGIRYLDAGSRGAGDGSRNYVVFDDKLIEIIRKYGWAAAAPIFAASGLTVEEAQAQYEGQM